MILSLRARVLLVVLCLNACAFGIGGTLLYLDMIQEDESLVRQRTEDLLDTLASTSTSGTVWGNTTFRLEFEPGVANTSTILQWPWDSLEDAILVNDSLSEGEDGRISVAGLFLNPVGRPRRSSSFDQQAVLKAIRRAMRDRRPVEEVAGGEALPIFLGDKVWGGYWYRSSSRVGLSRVVGLLSPWFLVSTAILTVGSYLALRKLVLDPVEQLAHGARRVRAGDFAVRLEEPARKDEMADLVRSFNTMTEQVGGFNVRLEREVRTATNQARRAEAAAMTQRRLAAMGELAAGIAHEINNPLGGLRNAVEVLRRDDLDPEKRRRYLDLLGRGLERIGETVDRLRRVTPREGQDDDVDLLAVIQDACDLVRHRADRLGVRLELVGPATPVHLRGARNELGQCFLNLLANALDALEEGGSRDPGGPRVEVRVVLEGDLRITVQDNGPGVPPSELPRVADLFYTTKDVGKGTGLGLALVHNVVRAHEGTLQLSSEEGEGFRAELLFPASRRVAEEVGRE